MDLKYKKKKSIQLSYSNNSFKQESEDVQGIYASINWTEYLSPPNDGIDEATSQENSFKIKTDFFFFDSIKFLVNQEAIVEYFRKKEQPSFE